MNSKQKVYQALPDEVEAIGKKVLDAAFQVHTALGPGLLESVYEACLAHELKQSGLNVQTQVVLPVTYKELRIEAGFRLDFLIEQMVIVEIKAIETIIPLHQAQLLTYLKLAGLYLGYLINFNVPHLKNGIKRMVA